MRKSQQLRLHYAQRMCCKQAFGPTRMIRREQQHIHLYRAYRNLASQRRRSSKQRDISFRSRVQLPNFKVVHVGIHC